MTKRNLRKTAALLAAISLFSCGAGACKKRGDGEDNGYQSGGNTVTIGAADTHVSGTLHKVNVTENENRIFAKNGVTQYKIAVTDDVRAKEAANFIAKHVYWGRRVTILKPRATPCFWRCTQTTGISKPRFAF